MNLNENPGRFTLGTGEAIFELYLDYPSGGPIQPGAPRDVRHYGDGIGYIGLVAAAVEHPERFEDLTALPMSNRIERTGPGDVLVMLNRQGYWALLMIDDLVWLIAIEGVGGVIAGGASVPV